MPQESIRRSIPAGGFGTFILFIVGILGAHLASAAVAAKPLKIYILAGQSNMRGHAKVSTFEHVGMDPATQPMLAEMLGRDGTPKVCEQVCISSVGCADAEQTGKRTFVIGGIGKGLAEAMAQFIPTGSTK